MAIGKCKVCGSDINERMKFCSACGTPIERPIAPEAPMATIAPEAPTTQTGPVMPVAPIMPVAQEAPIVQEAPIAPTTPEAPIVPATPEAPVAPVVSAAAAPVPIESAATAPVSSPSEPVSIPPAPAVVPSEAAAYAPAPALVPPASAAYASAAVVVPPAPAAPPVYAPATADASTPAAPPTYAPTAAAAAPEPAVKSVSTLHAMAKLFAKPVIVAVAVVIAAAVVWNIVKPAKYGQEKAMLSIQQADDTVVVTINGKQTAEIEGYQRSASGNFGRSLDNTKAIILVEEERNSGDSEGYALYTQDGKMIADGVVSAQISLSGEGVAFVQDADFRARVGELCLYTGGKTTSITVDYNLDGNLILSPNGKTVAYTIMDDDDVVACYYDGKTHELGDNLTPVAVADGAKYVYYYNRNNSYYVQPGANSDKKEMLGKNVISMHFNRSLSQVVYSAPVENAQGAANQEKTYISRNGGAKSDLRGTFRGFVTPSGTAENDWAADVASFADTLYTDGNSVYYINGKFEAASVVTNVYAPYLAGDGKTLTYMRSDSIYQVDGTNDSAERVELVDGGVFQFVATADGKAVFFVNDDYEVCYQKGRGKPVTVGEDFTANPGVFRLFKGQKLFYVSDDELCSSSGGKGVSVRGIDGDVLSVSGGMYGVTVTTDDGGETLTYYSADGNKFTLSN